MFNLSGLSRAATGTRRALLSNICANESPPDGGAEVRTVVETGGKANVTVYCQHMLHYGISGNFQALANVLRRCIKSVSPEKKI